MRQGWRPASPVWAARWDALGLSLARARSSRRLALFMVLYLALTACMAWRLVTVQVVQAAEYRSLAERQIHREIELPGRRGRLYTRSGDPLAMSLSAATIYANPRVFVDQDIDPTLTAVKLAPLVGLALDEVMALLEKDAAFVYLARQLPRAVGEQIAALELPGIGVIDEPTRVYPAGALAVQTVGFAGIDNTGLSGLESQYDDVLAGRPGRVRLERAPGGLTIDAAGREVVPPVPGTDVVLSLDRQIQYQTERVLAEGVARYGAKGATGLVLDARTGEVLAMASVPTYEQEQIGDLESYVRRNRVVTDMFEPGSVSKVITLAAAIEQGITSPGEVLHIPRTYEHGGKQFRDSSPHPSQDMSLTEVMATSSNIGTIKIAERLGAQRLHDALREFGYGSPTGIDFPGEAAGLLPTPGQWSATSLPTIAIGQGVSATLLQVAGAFGVIANGGEWLQPVLVRGTVGPDGRLHAAQPGARRRVVSERTAELVRQMLAAAVSDAGTGTLANVDGYRIVGKTGTAQKPSTTRRGYEDGKYVASFVGFAPAEDPQLIVAVTFDEPTPIYGGLTAAPAFSQIMGFALGHRRIPPSDPSAAVAAGAEAGEGQDWPSGHAPNRVP